MFLGALLRGSERFCLTEDCHVKMRIFRISRQLRAQIESFRRQPFRADN